MQLLSPKYWKEYELIDCGNFEKLERFGDYICIRPEPQAVWDPQLSAKEWQSQAHLKFVSKSSSAGTWQKLKTVPDRWHIKYKLHASGKKNAEIAFRLALTSFKHVGIFPEQSENWEFIYQRIQAMQASTPKVLNLFAYTGGASLAAKAAGADVTHLDSIKQVVSWSRENMELSGLQDIRWLVEDAMTFVKREVKRGKKYNGIILDPPAYGQGANGERWKLEDNINEMLKLVGELLDEKEHFLVLNTYSLGFSSLIIENLLRDSITSHKQMEIGEIYLHSKTDIKLPLGVFGRGSNF